MNKTLPCPHCGRENNRHWRAAGDQFEPGDVGICWGCNKPSLFTAFGLLRKPTAQEDIDIRASSDFKLAMAARAESGGGSTPTQVIALYRRNTKPKGSA